MTRDIHLFTELSGGTPIRAALFARITSPFGADIAAAMAAKHFNVLHLVKLVQLDFIVRKDSPYGGTSSPAAARATAGFEAGS